jgi:hypothetical protein
VAIVSKEGEKVDLVTPIDPHSYDGKVEGWLSDLETTMRRSIKEVIHTGFRDYPFSRVEDAVETLSSSTSKAFLERQ